jgi:hypothetical protein
MIHKHPTLLQLTRLKHLTGKMLLNYARER